MLGIPISCSGIPISFEAYSLIERYWIQPLRTTKGAESHVPGIEWESIRTLTGAARKNRYGRYDETAGILKGISPTSWTGLVGPHRQVTSVNARSPNPPKCPRHCSCLDPGPMSPRPSRAISALSKRSRRLLKFRRPHDGCGHPQAPSAAPSFGGGAPASFAL